MLRMINHPQPRNRRSSQAFTQFVLATIRRTSSTTPLEDPNFFITIMDYARPCAREGSTREKTRYYLRQKNNVTNSLLPDLWELGGQGWCSGKSTRLPPLWLGFDFLTQRHMWIEFVGSLLCSKKFFPGYSSFPLLPKKTTLDLICRDSVWFVVSSISKANVLG